MTNMSLFLIIVAVSFAVILAYFVGGRRNKKKIREIASELEELFDPVDKEYTNIGGFVGYHFNYEIENEFIEKIRGTITLLPRHSILFYPISLLTSKSDKLFITITLRKAITEEIHIIAKELRSSRLHEITNSELEENLRGSFIIYYKSKKGETFAKKCADIMEHAEIKHLALFPPEKRVYAFIIPKNRGEIKKFKEILSFLKDYFL
ncbi:hypothetical protein DRP44_03345 [candidate division TA06 bacterium]|uniref:Uncharacterized protein n=1 Tax=candidate division TA06 bacterium TaxID=2250710 RepID=A0A660S927_UNCT6|nr:MAG: hypothetical protein DRP44_03345 [candidate division TA06 bacterium]